MIRTFCPQTGGTFMDNELKKTIVAADNRAQYDESVKRLLSHKEILAHILVHTVDEFKGMNPKDVIDYIEGEPYVGVVPVEPGITNSDVKNPETGEDIVMTTDFLVTISSEDGPKNVARTIKSKEDLLAKRIIEKFEIERVYWEKRGIDWGIVTDQEIDKNIAHNISFIQSYKEIHNVDVFNDMDAIEIQDMVYEFIKRIIDNERSVRCIATEFDKDMSLKSGCGLSIYKYLIINKIIQIDLSQKIDVNKNIPVLSVNDAEIKKAVEAI